LCKEREAKVHLTQVIGKKAEKFDLCEECAEQKGVNDPRSFRLSDFLLGLAASRGWTGRSGASPNSDIPIK
jgi:protein arginine kinase activator